ncbi:MAG: transcriptional regulator [Firmicutes bacterium]|nr:transcriptional regulator [Bacillota bacterium]
MQVLEEKLGFLLNVSARLIFIDLSSKLKDYDLTTTQWATLKDLCDQDGNIENCTPALIAKRLHSDRPTISGVIERLVEKEFITRHPHAIDRRSQIIQVTNKTLSIIKEIDEAGDQVIAKATKSFDATELNQLKNFLKRIIANFD